jgi:catechol 2,3-dioxygenase-like lactoylglutathione lyase family enzyme
MGMHVIDRTDKFTLVGADARRGKLTLFAAEPERAPGPLARIGLRVFDLDEALAELPPDLAVERPEEGRVEFDGPQRIPFALVVAEDGVAYDLDHVAFRVADPETTFAQLAELGFDVVERGLEIADIVDAANTYAVFVWGPDRIKLEYVEHKPTFSLV